MRRARSFRLIAGVSTAVTALVLSACGNSGTTTPSTSSAAAGSTTPAAASASSGGAAGSATSSAAGTGTGAALTVGMAYDTGGRGDGTFNDSAATGAEKAKADLGVTVNELVPVTGDDRTPNVQLLSNQKNDPIICVGYLFQSTLESIAPANPDLTYAIIDTVVDQPNVKSLVFAAEQGSFLVGVAAALKSTTGKIGFIGGADGSLIQSFEAGYVAGAKAAKPDITIDIKYLGPDGDDTVWNVPDKAKEIAKSWYDGGTDVIFSAAGGSGTGTIDAAVEATAGGTQKWAIGVDQDQYALATPDQQKVLLTSMVKRVDVAIYDAIKAVSDGDKSGGTIVFDLKSDGVGYATSGGYVDDIKAQIDGFKQQIIDGKITVPSTRA